MRTGILNLKDSLTFGIFFKEHRMRLRGLRIPISAWICLTVLCSATTVAQDPPDFTPFHFTSEPASVTVVSGSPVVLNCTVESSLSLVFLWSKDNALLAIDSSLYSLDLSGSLRIRSVRVSNNAEGTYQCQAHDPSYRTIVSRKATVTIAAITMTGTPSNVNDVYQGDTARFECKVESQGPYTVQWQKDRVDLDLTSERTIARYTILPSGTLEIKSLRNSDEGSFRCRVFNPMNPTEVVTSLDASLVVNNGEPDPYRELEFLVEPEDVKTVVGSRVVLEAATKEPATFTWFKNDAEITVGSFYSTVGQGSLQIDRLDEIHTGVYTVKAESMDRSTVESTVLVLALVPPSFTTQPSNMYANEASEARLPCRVYGIPPPTVKWLKDQNVLEPGEHYEIVDGNGLLIKSVIETDTGYYQCFAENEVGSNQKTMELIVLGPGVPIPVMDFSTQASTTSSTVSPTTTPLTSTAFNPGPVIGPRATPPVGLTASRTTSRTTTLYWRPPATLNGKLDRYRISIQPESGSRERTIYVSGENLSKRISDLVPATTYNIRIMAITENGPGLESEAISITTEEAQQVPEAPTIRATIVESSSSVFISWERPLDSFGDITSYLLYYALQSGGVSREQKLTVRGTSATINGLSPFSMYGFRVEAVNENGAGASSAIAELRTLPAKPSGPPSNFTCSQTELTSSLLLRWEPPPLAYQNGDIIEYKIKYRKQNERDSKAKVISVSSSLRNFEVKELERDTSYSFKMAAVNSNGTGPFTSDWITQHTLRHIMHATSITATTLHVTTPAVTPLQPAVSLDMPRNVKALTLSATDIRIKWEDFNPAPLPLDNRVYTVYYRVDDESNQRYMKVNSTTTAITISDLEPFTPYAFYVKVISRKGTSDESLIASNTTFEAVPVSAPTDLKVHRIENSSTSLILTWEPPVKPNGRIQSYMVFYTNGSDKINNRWYQEVVEGEVKNTVVRGLQKNTEYTFKIKARNSQGFGPDSETVTESTAPGAVPLVDPGDNKPIVSEAPGFPVWVWLLILGLIFLILFVALLLLICVLCGCCRCCSSCCPGNLCAEACGCLGGGAGGSSGAGVGAIGGRSSAGNCLSQCWSICCPCCCAEDAFKEALQGLPTPTYKSNGGKKPDVLIELDNNIRKAETDSLITGHGETDHGRVLANGGLKRQKDQSYASEPLLTKSEEVITGDRGFHGSNHVRSTHDSTLNKNVNVNIRHYDSDHGAETPHSVITPVVTYPEGTDPFTITFEETTTHHTVEKSVPLFDGTHYKTVSSHETHAKSYSTSDASKDRNLQMMLQNGLSSGPLAIEIPSTEMESLPAITVPHFTSNSQLNAPSVESYSTGSQSLNQNHTLSSSDLHHSNRSSNIRTDNIRSDFTQDFQNGTTQSSYFDNDHDVSNTHFNQRSPPPVQSNSYEEHSERRYQDFGSSTLPPRVDVSTRFAEGANGNIIRSGEMKDSYFQNDHGIEPFAPQQSFVEPLAPAPLSSLSDLRYSTNNADMQRSTATDHHQHSSLYSSAFSSNQMQDSQMSDFQNTGSNYRYNTIGGMSTAPSSNITPDLGYYTVDRSEGVDRIENLRRITNKVLSASHQRLASPHFDTGLQATHSASTDHLDRGGSRTFETIRESQQRYNSHYDTNGYRGQDSFKPSRLNQNGGNQNNITQLDSQFSFNNNNSSRSDLRRAVSPGHLEVSELSRSMGPMYVDDLSRSRSPPVRNNKLLRSLSPEADGNISDIDDSSEHDVAENRKKKTPLQLRHEFLESERRDVPPQPLRGGTLMDRPCSPVMSPPGYDYHSSGSSTRTMGMERPPYIYSSGYHSDTTVSSGGHDEPSSHSGNRQGNPNLSSFTVPGPPPHYSSTGPSRVRISAPSYSPLKRTGQPSTVKVRAQPLPVGTPRAPDVTYSRNAGATSPGSTTRTFSTEDLNAEMQHLEGLMKDLNAITASELENN